MESLDEGGDEDGSDLELGGEDVRMLVSVSALLSIVLGVFSSEVGG